MEKLWSLLTGGDDEGYEYLFDRYYLKLCRMAFMYVQDAFVAEDLVGDLFFYLWKNRSNLQINESVDAYLYSSIRNRAINYLNQASVNYEVSLSNYEDSDHFSAWESEDEQPDEQVVQKELEDRIEKALASLPPQTRKVFDLKRMHDYTYEEIASRLHVSVNTVRYHIKTALKRLRLELKDYWTIFFPFLIDFFLKDLPKCVFDLSYM